MSSQLSPAQYGINRTRKGMRGFRLSTILAAVILALILIPSFQAIFGYHLIRYLVVLFVAWIVVVHKETPSNLMWILSYEASRVPELFIYVYWWALVLIYAWASQITGFVLSRKMSDPISMLYVMSQITICYVLALVYASQADGNVMRWLKHFILVAVGMNAILALPSLLTQGTTAARDYMTQYLTNSPGQVPQTLSLSALGGIELYMIDVLLVPYFLTVILESKRFTRFIYIIFFIACTLNVMLCTILLVQIGFVIALLVTFLWNMRQRKTRMVTQLGLIVLAGVIFYIGYSLSGTVAMQYSLNRVLKYTNPADASVYIRGDTYQQRVEIYSASFQAFLRYPLLGAGVTAITGSLDPEIWIGGHSGFLDGFAMYGLLFSIYPVFLLLKYSHLQKLYRQNRQDMWLFSSILFFVIYIYLCIFDPMIFSGPVTGLFFFLIAGSTMAKVRNNWPARAADGKVWIQEAGPRGV